MRFTLHYRGPLKANAEASEKHKLRMKFHEQVRDLWEREPLKGNHKWLCWTRYLENKELEKEDRKWVCAVQERGEMKFSAVVHEMSHLIADLDILILRPGAPGDLVKDGGDIDNRLKTLFDALTIPDENQARRLEPPSDRSLLHHCVFEDDKLITGFSCEHRPALGLQVREGGSAYRPRQRFLHHHDYGQSRARPVAPTIRLPS